MPDVREALSMAQAGGDTDPSPQLVFLGPLALTGLPVPLDDSRAQVSFSSRVIGRQSTGGRVLRASRTQVIRPFWIPVRPG